MAAGDIDRLVETIDADPDMLHPESTPSGNALIARGMAALPAVLPLLAGVDPDTRRRAVRVLEAITMGRFGFRRGRGWEDPLGETRWRAFWADMGGLGQMGGPAGEETIAKWRAWYERERS